MNRFKSLLTAACMAGSVCLVTVATAQQPGGTIKGNAVLATTTVTATVVKINQKTRAVTVKAADGQEYSFVVGEAATNFSQVKKGDVITATYTEAVAYELKKGGSAGATVTAGGAAAPTGSKPGAAVGGAVTVTVAIAAIDPKTPSVTFKSASGETRTVKVQSPDKLAGVNVGDTVQLTYVEAVAMKVEPATKK